MNNFLLALNMIIENDLHVELYDRVLNKCLCSGNLTKHDNNYYLYINHEWVFTIREIHDVTFTLNSVIVTI